VYVSRVELYYKEWRGYGGWEGRGGQEEDEEKYT